MVSGIDAAARGMLAQQINMDVLANNLANINTSGFKQLIPVFRSMEQRKPTEEQEIEDKEAENFGSPPIMISTGCMVESTFVDFKQGALSKTDNNLDFAINGEGFFVVEKDGKEFYTRNGNFSLNEDGSLVASDGYLVMSESGGSIDFNIRDNSFQDIKIRDDGVLMLGKEEVAGLKVVNFKDPGKELLAAGSSLFKPINKDVKPIEADKYKIEQGFIECSNANTVETMIKTITATRTYETLSKVLQASDHTLTKAVNDVGRVIA